MAPEAIKFLDSGAEVHAQHNNRPPARFRFQLLQNIQVNILREVGKRLLAAVAAGGDPFTSNGVAMDSDNGARAPSTH